MGSRPLVACLGGWRSSIKQREHISHDGLVEQFRRRGRHRDGVFQAVGDGSDQRRALRPKPVFDGRADRNYNLKNKRVRKFLQWEEQTFGINLGWTDDAEPATATKVMRWFIARNGHGDRPVRYGETIALGYGIKPSFIRNAHRDVGIDLEWSDTPVFEWKLLGGKHGEEVTTGQWFAIYNTRSRECLLHFDRTVGGDIGWPSSRSWGDQLEDRIRDAVKDHWTEAVGALLAAA